MADGGWSTRRERAVGICVLFLFYSIGRLATLNLLYYPSRSQSPDHCKCIQGEKKKGKHTSSSSSPPSPSSSAPTLAATFLLFGPFFPAFAFPAGFFFVRVSALATDSEYSLAPLFAVAGFLLPFLTAFATPLCPVTLITGTGAGVEDATRAWGGICG